MGIVAPTGANDLQRALLHSRLGCYQFFYRLFRAEVDDQLLDELTSGDLAAAASEFALDFGSTETLRRASLIEELATDFANCFLGPGRHVSPHESVQVSADGRLNGPPAVAVQRFYRVSGFQYHGTPEHSDHICVELEYMASLLQIELESMENSVDEVGSSQMLQAEFMTQHLGQWILPFCDKFGTEAETRFYRQLASTTHAFMSDEIALLVY